MADRHARLHRRQGLRLLGVMTLLAQLAHAASAGAAAMVCPTTLQAGVADQFERVGSPPTSAAPFDTLNIVEGEPGDEAKYAPVALVPDTRRGARNQRINVWDLSPRDRPLLMVCSYRGTPAYLRAVIPEALRVCELTIDEAPRAGQCR